MKNEIFIFNLHHAKQNLVSVRVSETFESCGGGELFLGGDNKLTALVVGVK